MVEKIEIGWFDYYLLDLIENLREIKGIDLAVKENGDFDIIEGESFENEKN